MPTCAIVTCNNRSESTNLAINGITFHRFPCDPEIKEKWITATGKGPVWWPLKSSTICSVHFKENEFRPLLKSRRLFDWVVPTQKLPHVVTSVLEKAKKPLIQLSSTNKSTATRTVTKLASEPSSSTRKDKDMKYIITPGNLKMRQQIERYKSQILQKNMKIRSLQKKNSRYQKRITDLKEVVKELREKNSDDVIHLEY